MFAKQSQRQFFTKVIEMKTTTKKTASKTTNKKTTKSKSSTKKIVRIFNANNENIDRFRSRLKTSASRINLLFIAKPKHVFTCAEIVKITKLKKSRVSVHLYWLSKTFDHIVKRENGYVMNVKPKSLQNK